MKQTQEINDICKEVLIILSQFSDNLIEKIPSKVFINLRELATDSKVNFYIEPEKHLYEQNISEKGKDLISLIYYNYIADENEKKELLKLWSDNENKYQEKLKEKYNTDNLFKKEKTTANSEMQMIEYKEDTVFTKIRSWIKHIIKNMASKY